MTRGFRTSTLIGEQCLWLFDKRFLPEIQSSTSEFPPMKTIKFPLRVAAIFAALLVASVSFAAQTPAVTDTGAVKKVDRGSVRFGYFPEAVSLEGLSFMVAVCHERLAVGNTSIAKQFPSGWREATDEELVVYKKIPEKTRSRIEKSSKIPEHGRRLYLVKGQHTGNTIASNRR